MNNTPTPLDLDNLPLNEALRFADENSTTGGLVTQAALKTLAAGCRELTAAREELAELKEEYGTWWAQKRIAIDELKEVTEQRDEARRLAEKYRNLSCQDQDQADATLLPWETNQPTKPEPR